MFVNVDPPGHLDPIRFIHFRIVTNLDLEEASLELLWDLPEGLWIYDPVFRMTRNGTEYDDFEGVNRDIADPRRFKIALPLLKPGEGISLSMGWQGAVFEEYEAWFLIDRGTGNIPFFGGWRP